MKLTRISDGENIASVSADGALKTTSVGISTEEKQSDSILLLYELKGEFEQFNKNLQVIIKQLSFITEQEIDKED
jgi:hypothetical protein